MEGQWEDGFPSTQKDRPPVVVGGRGPTTCLWKVQGPPNLRWDPPQLRKESGFKREQEAEEQLPAAQRKRTDAKKKLGEKGGKAPRSKRMHGRGGRSGASGRSGDGANADHRSRKASRGKYKWYRDQKNKSKRDPGSGGGVQGNGRR